MVASFLAFRHPGKHPGEFVDPVFSRHGMDGCNGPVPLDHDVVIGERRHLRQVGHAEHLATPGQGGQLATDGERRTSADPRVDLVEGNDVRVAGTTGEPKCQNQAAELTS